ncbi:Methionine--tRNA ligase [Candidatus Bilamarchaeum dharawalense]|uniref:Methionine--tRNA ligase n=1 Tax=Candidatus Bilamarchaeum dharawalense TaxID=2885759 RepID=A0A5E4LSP3_9ARCH|nr:Methionine--tRNA ligase [Candidatus Bilamarchaeum dharawalense]
MKILITSALPYVNNVPHLGNIIGCVLSADVYARYCRSREYDCLYICGTDEYGTATEIKALEEGVTPKEICDKYYKIHKDIYEWFGIKFDIFGRTSTEKHTKITQDIFTQLHSNGYVVEDEVEQFYDEKADMFLADRYIEGTCPHCNSAGARSDQCDKCGKLLHPGELIDPVSKVTKTKPILRKTKHLFINLPGIEIELAKWIRQTAIQGFWSENSIKIAESWLKEGLKKRAITRDLKWGVKVPLPGYERKVFYVWFDAPIGYISITANLTDQWKEWWLNPKDVRLYQFMGKDNVPFHTVIFPSTLMGTKGPWTLLHHISTTEFLNYEGDKFSKSRKIGVFGDDAMTSGIAPDVWRYYLLANRPEQADTNFVWADFADKNNNELLANIGNLVNRTLVFIKNNFNGKIPDFECDESPTFDSFHSEKIKTITKNLETVKLKQSLHETMGLSSDWNRYFQSKKPWEGVKAPPPPEGGVNFKQNEAKIAIYLLANAVKDLAILIEPHLPATSKEIFNQLNIQPKKWDDLGKLTLNPGHEIGNPKTLFRKIEPKEVETLKARYSGKQAVAEPKFCDLDLEVGQIVSAEKHPNAEKLFVEKVLLGDGERQIVSGLAGHYFPEELVGRKVVVVKNLAPAKLRGVESQGMLLAAEGKEFTPPHEGKATMEVGALEVIFCDKSKVGEKITLKGERSAPKKTITISEVEKVKIVVKNFIVQSEGKQLVSESEELIMKNVKEGDVG